MKKYSQIKCLKISIGTFPLIPVLVNKLCNFFKAYYKTIAYYSIIGVKMDPSAVIFWQNEKMIVNEKNWPTILEYKREK